MSAPEPQLIPDLGERGLSLLNEILRNLYQQGVLRYDVTTSDGGRLILGNFSIPYADTAVGDGTCLFRVLANGTAIAKWSALGKFNSDYRVLAPTFVKKGLAAGSTIFKVQVQQLAGGGSTVSVKTGQSTMSAIELKP